MMIGITMQSALRSRRPSSRAVRSFPPIEVKKFRRPYFRSRSLEDETAESHCGV